MIKSDRLEGLQDRARYYEDMVMSGSWHYIGDFLIARSKLTEHMKNKRKDIEQMKILKQLVESRIKHNEARLAWKKDLHLEGMSHAARSFSAGSSAAWVSEIYFLKGVLEKIDEQ